MTSERTLPKKHPQSVRPARELNALVARCLEENRSLTMEGAELLCGLQVCVSRLHEIKRARVLEFCQGSSTNGSSAWKVGHRSYASSIYDTAAL